jgi:hypothetical protein
MSGYQMKKELKHFQIGDSYGGSQDWFPTFMMKIGGCGAQTACDSSMYFALHRGLSGIAPENAASLTREDYIDFAYKMKPYLSPRMTGIDRLEIYIDGYEQYLRDCGETRLQLSPFHGTESYESAREVLKGQIDQGYPVPTLILNHQDKEFEDYVWHWFLINGYDDSAGFFLVKAVTYSNYRWLDFARLWDTGHKRRGGLILYSIKGTGDLS